MHTHGASHHSWKGGRHLSSLGYVRIYVGKGHPMAMGDTPYAYEHRLVMADKLGRYLLPSEIVHHIDEDIQNNHPDNLEIRSRGEHMREHYAGKPRPSAQKQRRENGKFAPELDKKPREKKKPGYAPAPIEDRLWPKIDQSGGPDACHPFMGSRNKFGYGRFFMPGRPRGNDRVPAHVVVWELIMGPIEDPSLVVRHTCDHPWCCNIRHLLLGTIGDNNRDRANRGRGRENRQYGEANSNCKVGDEDIPEVFRLYHEEKWSQQKIADLYRVQQPQISRILNKKQRINGSSPKEEK